MSDWDCIIYLTSHLYCTYLKALTLKEILVFFQNEVIFVQLDELDKLDTITHA